MSPRINKRKVSEMIVDEIIEQIRVGTLKAGQQLMNERDLAESLGVSRMPLREAIHALHQIGILESRHGQGTFVCHYNAEKAGRTLYWYTLLGASPLFDLIDTRRLLEGEAARQASLNATEEDLARIRETMLERERVVEAAKDSGRFEDQIRRFEADRDFHAAIAVASHNGVFTQFLTAIRATMKIHQETSGRSTHVIQDVTRLHRDLYEAISSGDADRAEAVMHEHMDLIKEAMREEIGADAEMKPGQNGETHA